VFFDDKDLIVGDCCDESVSLKGDGNAFEGVGFPRGDNELNVLENAKKRFTH